MYDIEVSQRPDGRWAWTVTTQDFKKHPLYERDSGMSFRRNCVTGKAKTAEKAMSAASKFVAEYVAGDLMKQLTTSFNDAAPCAVAST